MVQPGQSYVGSSDPRVHFGLGPAASIEHIEVQWPNGGREQFDAADVDRVITLVQGTGRPL